MQETQSYNNVFDLDWFKKHQKKLVWFANTILGRYVLRLGHSSIGKNKVKAIGPHFVAWKEGGENKVEYRTHDKYGKRLYYAFLPVWYLIHGWDMMANSIRQPGWNLGFDTLTAYPAAGANSPVDGEVGRNGTNLTWTDLRTGAGTYSSATGTSMRAWTDCGTIADRYDISLRAIFLFDTSSLGSGASISSAVLSLYGNGTSSSSFSGNAGEIGIVSSNPASNAAIANGDYDYNDFGTTDFASRIAFTTWGTGAPEQVYHDFTLNASGVSNISLTGISKFGARTGWDIDNSPVWESGASCSISSKTADNAGTTTDPKLVVTYTPGATGSVGDLSLLGIG